MKPKKIPAIRSLSELYRLADGGDERYQRLCIVALNNLGCDHLATGKQWKNSPKWKAYHHGLGQYVDALVGEYGETEDDAFRQVLEEINNVRDCIDQAQLEWGK